jgi:large repetitive protein
MTLVNQGLIDANGGNGLVVDTGSNTVVNTGTLEASGNGGMLVNSAVSGGGNALISGPATLEFAAASDAKVTFAVGAAGLLKLDQSGSFTGTVSGLTAGDGLDLTDISFGAGATLGYAAIGVGTGGTLTVSDGMHTTSLALLGQYAAAGFQTTADQGGGAIITYTSAQAGTTDPTLLTNPQHTA